MAAVTPRLTDRAQAAVEMGSSSECTCVGRPSI
jgi:hypothetical protein